MGGTQILAVVVACGYQHTIVRVFVCLPVADLIHFRGTTSAFNECLRAVAFCALTCYDGTGDAVRATSLTLPSQVSEPL